MDDWVHLLIPSVFLSKGQNGGAHVSTSTCSIYPAGKQYLPFEVSKPPSQSWLEVWGLNIFVRRYQFTETAVHYFGKLWRT